MLSLKNHCLKALILLLVILFAFSAVSCSKSGMVDIDGEVGAYYLMFRTATDNYVQIARFENLSFDLASLALSDDEKNELGNLIKEYCDEKKVNYFESSFQELRKANKIINGAHGDEYKNGYFLSFSLCEWREDEHGEYFTGNVEFWHNGLDAVGCLDFRIRHASGGWYVDDGDGTPGYVTMVS